MRLLLQPRTTALGAEAMSEPCSISRSSRRRSAPVGDCLLFFLRTRCRQRFLHLSSCKVVTAAAQTASSIGKPAAECYSSLMDQPVICTLTEAEMLERQHTIRNALRQAVLAVTELPDGFAYTCSATPDSLLKLSELVNLERQCCASLNFKIIVEAAPSPIRLEITGPPQAKKLIAEFFGSVNE